MSGATSYSAVEHLRDGRSIEIRALRPDDTAGMLAAIERTSMQSLQRRFFVIKRGFSVKEIDFFINVDFDKHVALVAQLDEDGRSAIVGGGRYVLLSRAGPRSRSLWSTRTRDKASAQFSCVILPFWRAMAVSKS